jgi:hypothetical protein
MVPVPHKQLLCIQVFAEHTGVVPVPGPVDPVPGVVAQALWTVVEYG